MIATTPTTHPRIGEGGNFRAKTDHPFEADGLGSVRTPTAANGKRAASSGLLTNPFQYTGREFDTETGL